MVTIQDLNLDINKSSELEFNGVKFNVLHHLSMDEKLNIIEIVNQNALDEGFINPIFFEVLIKTYSMIKYTDIDFSETLSNEGLLGLYDMLKHSGFMEAVLAVIATDYATLHLLCLDYLEERIRYFNSFRGSAIEIINSVPKEMTKALNELSEMDMSKVKDLFSTAFQTGDTSAVMNELFGQK